MANFEPICEWVLRQEDATLSGIVKDLGDGGGLTRYGVAQFKHSSLPQDFYTAAPAVALEDAKEIYKGMYWDRFLGDSILSDDVAACLLSFSINDGEAREIYMLQHVLKLQEDGVMGPITLRATNEANSAILASQLRTAQGDFYQKLAENRPDIAKDLPGLLARAHRMYPVLT